ncbi:MFS transporter [Novosphingobium sp. 1949]|uniref:MFS transporter n=1 Tax=Novosphingobium organovorum TaxID=2930092 RepID=A0ABT0BGT4_9SPHN|nr:MFS transporter [Novosphingobium organovorum]MCJ2184239.1 MFS transporter [Novosphingobium organovorum]
MSEHDTLALAARREPASRAPALARLLDTVGIPAPLIWGYLGMLLFMIGDGVETSFLSRLFLDFGLAQAQVGFVFTVYGITAAIGAYLAGALSDLWGPRKVMMLGAAIWLFFHVLMLTLALPSQRYDLILAIYGLRGFGYPLFAYGFMIWLMAGAPRERLNTALGWFWCAFTAGYPVIGSLLAALLLGPLLPTGLLWLSLGLVASGAAIALVLLREPHGFRPLADKCAAGFLRTLTGGITIMVTTPAVGRGALVRLINTTSQFGIWVFFPILFTQKLGFTLSEWATLLSIMMGSNMVAVILVGMISDRWSWRKSSALFGGVLCSAACLVLYYVPVLSGHVFPVAALAAMVYGVALAGYIAVPPMMAAQAPDRQGQVMSAYNLGAGASVAVGPLIGTLFIDSIGLQGVVWIYAALHLISAGLCLSIRSPGDGRPA